MSVKRFLRDLLKRTFLHIYKVGTRLGIHILPVHYYSPIPDIVELQKTKDIWAKKSELPGLSVNLDEQVRDLRTICIAYQGEYAGNKVYREGVDKQFGPGYGYIEAQALHAVIRYYKPKNIIEVGSGISSYCMLRALELNSLNSNGGNCSLTCIEPYPTDKLNKLIKINLISNIVQNVPINIFEGLNENDLLFIDSSHTVKPGGDVNYLILEVLPRLKRGVIIHFHDIYFPFDYQPDVLNTFAHWTETSLLRAFLIFNNKAKIIFCLSQLHYDRKEALSEVFPEYSPQHNINGLRDERYTAFANITEHFPASIYIQMQ